MFTSTFKDLRFSVSRSPFGSNQTGSRFHSLFSWNIEYIRFFIEYIPPVGGVSFLVYVPVRVEFLEFRSLQVVRLLLDGDVEPQVPEQLGPVVGELVEQYLSERVSGLPQNRDKVQDRKNVFE